MLYERWRQIAHERAADPALCDLASGRRFNFAELASAADGGSSPADPIAFPQGISAEFVLTVLRAWRHGQVVCPIEVSQSPPALRELPHDCVHVKTTSASTGPGRCILFTAEQLAADANHIVATMGLRADWPNLGAISLAHSYGFSNLVLPLLLHGIPLYVLNSSLPEAVRQTVASTGPCTLPAVPALWRAWHEAGAVSPNIKLAISAGAPLPLALEEAVFRQHGLKLHNFYGASECGGIAYDTSAAPRTDPACIGAPMANVALRVGEGGCLEVRSRAVGQTYWPTPDPSLADGCFRTSDLAEQNDGQVYLRGRATEQINVAGRKVSPEWIESKLAQHPAVRECFVFGVPSDDTSRGEAIVACIVPRTTVTAGQLKQFLLGQIVSWQVPREWIFLGALPTNQRGKLSRAEWRSRYLPGKSA